MFPVGTICIGQNLQHHPECNGMECEILELPKLRWVHSRRGRYRAVRYVVLWADGVRSAIAPEKLRKRPPREDFKGELRILELFKEKETA